MRRVILSFLVPLSLGGCGGSPIAQFWSAYFERETRSCREEAAEVLEYLIENQKRAERFLTEDLALALASELASEHHAALASLVQRRASTMRERGKFPKSHYYMTLRPWLFWELLGVRLSPETMPAIPDHISECTEAIFALARHCALDADDPLFLSSDSPDLRANIAYCHLCRFAPDAALQHVTAGIRSEHVNAHVNPFLYKLLFVSSLILGKDIESVKKEIQDVDVEIAYPPLGDYFERRWREDGTHGQ